MPFKPVAEDVDYPERFSSRPKDPLWIAIHQKQNLERILGRYGVDLLDEIILKEKNYDKIG